MMTKAELIKFLEPFDDDTKILKYSENYGEYKLLTNLVYLFCENDNGLFKSEKGFKNSEGCVVIS